MCVSPVKTGRDVTYGPLFHAKREAADHYPFHIENTYTHTLSGVDNAIFFLVGPPVTQSNMSNKPTAQTSNTALTFTHTALQTHADTRTQTQTVELDKKSIDCFYLA